jgi:hypothetical protein
VNKFLDASGIGIPEANSHRHFSRLWRDLETNADASITFFTHNKYGGILFPPYFVSEAKGGPGKTNDIFLEN